MAKKKINHQRKLGLNRGEYCPFCGMKVHHISSALNETVLIVHHFFVDRTCIKRVNNTTIRKD